MRATSASSRTSSSASTTTAATTSTRTSTRPVLRRLRGVQDRGRARRRQVPRPRHRARVDRGAQLVLPPLRLPGRAARDLRRAARVRAAGLPLQRGPQLHRGRSARLLDQPRDADLGGADPVGSRSGRLRLGRRARQLPERARITRPARTSSGSGRRRTSSRRTSSASTASTGRRCCSRPATSRRGSCSSTAT